MKRVVIFALMLVAFGAAAAAAERTINIEGLRYTLDFPDTLRYVSRDARTVRFADGKGLTLTFTRLDQDQPLSARAAQRRAMIEGEPLLYQQAESEYRILGSASTSPDRLVYFFGIDRRRCGIESCRFEFIIAAPYRPGSVTEIGSFVNPLIDSMKSTTFEAVAPPDSAVASGSGDEPSKQPMTWWQHYWGTAVAIIPGMPVGWEGHKFLDTGGDKYCMIAKILPDARYISFNSDINNFEVVVGEGNTVDFSEEDWFVGGGEDNPVMSVQFDSGASEDIVIKAWEFEEYALMMGYEYMERFQSAGEFTFTSAGGQSATIPLQGSRQALEKFVECRSQWR